MPWFHKLCTGRTSTTVTQLWTELVNRPTKLAANAGTVIRFNWLCWCKVIFLMCGDNQITLSFYTGGQSREQSLVTFNLAERWWYCSAELKNQRYYCNSLGNHLGIFEGKLGIGCQNWLYLAISRWLEWSLDGVVYLVLRWPHFHPS